MMLAPKKRAVEDWATTADQAGQSEPCSGPDKLILNINSIISND